MTAGMFMIMSYNSLNGFINYYLTRAGKVRSRESGPAWLPALFTPVF